jgi:eukaryotic-like serine/threonine-protein kinase
MNTGSLDTGAILDGFRIQEKFHQGGMATLWKVSRDDAAFPLVMKVPRIRYGDDPAAVVGFEVEQMILPALSGPYFPRFVASGDFTVQPYIAMELVAGTSLRDRLASAPLPPREVAMLGASVATALHELHRQNVIHLDIKPSSVILRPNGEAVLIDFGLAHHNQLPDLLAEQFRLPMGTGPYMSPEQVAGVRNEPRSDLFALGVTLYYLATGERPFGNPGSIGGLRRRMYRDPVPPRQLRPDCPPWLQEVILRCLEIDPDARYGTAGQLAFDLRHPEQITLTSRAARTGRDGMALVAKRWFKAIGAEPGARRSVADQLATAQIIMVAVDLSPEAEALGEVLRRAVRRVLYTEASARLACITVLKTSRVGIDIHVDEHGRSLRVQRLIELKHWARPLESLAERITFHVLEAPDPAAAIVDFARSNHVDHIVIGARGSSTLRRYLGSVSSQVVAEANCTVTVVKAGSSA